MDIKAIFGKVLKEIRSEKGISQEALALESGLDRSYVSKLETGVYQPSISTLFAIAGVFELKASELVDRVEKEINNK